VSGTMEEREREKVQATQHTGAYCNVIAGFVCWRVTMFCHISVDRPDCERKAWEVKSGQVDEKKEDLRADFKHIPFPNS
jgi:hypothetical protein